MESLRQLLRHMDPEFPELEARAAALLQAGYGNQARLKAARLEALQAVPGLLAGDAELIWRFYQAKAGDIPVPTHNPASLSSIHCSVSAPSAAKVAFDRVCLKFIGAHSNQHSEHTQNSLCLGLFACVCILKHLEQSLILPVDFDAQFMQLVS